MVHVPVTRRVAWKAEDLRRCAGFFGRNGARIGYIGWIADGNMGDEAMYLAHRRLLPDVRFAPLPTPRMINVLGRVLPHDLVQGVMLGGGTLIGWPVFRRPLEAVLSRGSLPVFMLSTGVEDPEFEVRKPTHAQALRGAWGHARSTRALVERELAQWVPLLSSADHVRVRGPRSAEVLQSLGLRPEVVGDPALLLADRRLSDSVDDRVLGLNVGLADGVWGDRPDRIFDAVVALGRVFSLEGWSVKLVPTWFGDVPIMRAAARQIGGNASVFERFRNLTELLAALRGCRVFVGEKLHSVVLASAVYTPAFALAYHPKCTDFQASLGREEFAMRTDRLDLAELAARVEDLDRRADEHRADLYAAVSSLRGRLEAAAAEIRRSRPAQTKLSSQC
jgi:polysaccharide pyruvyl transferase WcaK-like protein